METMFEIIKNAAERNEKQLIEIFGNQIVKMIKDNVEKSGESKMLNYLLLVANAERPSTMISKLFVWNEANEDAMFWYEFYEALRKIEQEAGIKDDEEGSNDE